MSQLLSTVKLVTRRVHVRTVHTLSSRVRRVIFTGAVTTNLTNLVEMPFDAAIKLTFPHRRAGNGRTLGRAYMIRRYHTAYGELEIDFVVHDETPIVQHGPAARWLGHAAPDDEIESAGPKWGFRADPAAPWALLIGDEIALSAASAILETLFEHAQALIHIAIDNAHTQLPLEGTLTMHPRSRNVYWVESDTAHAGVMMVRALSAQTMSVDIPQVFLTDEASLLGQVHTLLEGAWAMPYDAIDTKGY